MIATNNVREWSWWVQQSSGLDYNKYKHLGGNVVFKKANLEQTK